MRIRVSTNFHLDEYKGLSLAKWPLYCRQWGMVNGLLESIRVELWQARRAECSIHITDYLRTVEEAIQLAKTAGWTDEQWNPTTNRWERFTEDTRIENWRRGKVSRTSKHYDGLAVDFYVKAVGGPVQDPALVKSIIDRMFEQRDRPLPGFLKAYSDGHVHLDIRDWWDQVLTGLATSEEAHHDTSA